MSNAERNVIVRKDWQSSFTLIGKPVINDYSFKLNQKSEKSNWVYNSMNLAIDCGEKYGNVFAELMGGYSEDNENVIYAHGKNDDGSDNFDEQIIVEWDDRFNDDILERIGRLSFIRVGLEKTDKGETFYKDFLSAYDAIEYISKYISSDMVVTVKGNLRYSEYQGRTQVKKNITSVWLNKSVENPSDFSATFTQSVLIDKDSASLKNIDKDKGVMYVDGKVLDYVKEKNGVEIRGQYPFDKQFEFAMDLTNQSQCKAIVDKLFKVKKGYNQITFVGEFIEGGAIVNTTLDDIPDDIKDLIAMGLYTEEQALEACTSNGSRERRMVLKKPHIRLVGEEKTPVLQVFENRYTEDELNFDLGDDNEPPFDTDDSNSASMGSEDSGLDWLNSL